LDASRPQADASTPYIEHGGKLEFSDVKFQRLLILFLTMKLLLHVALVLQIFGKETVSTRKNAFLLLQQFFLYKALREQQHSY
jgi:hypothetical protein